MIRCNLSILLAERNLKISKVATLTGISRTTLTSLTNNYSQGIQFDTINTLCNFLNVGPEQIISYIPVDINLENVTLDDDMLQIDLLISKNSRSLSCALGGTCYTYFKDGKLCDIDINIQFYANDNEDIIKQNSLIIDSFKMLSAAFKTDIENKIYDKIILEFDEEIINNTLNYSFTWPFELMS